MSGPRRVRAGALALVLTLGGAAGATAQRDSVTIVPSTRYEAGPLMRDLLGSDYRDVWSTAIRVPVLDLASYAGGLEPVRRGGGQQTRSLRLLGADGREYNFRSVDKWVSPEPRDDLEGTAVEGFIQDQVSSLHPTGVPVATALLDAVGILNPAPRLFVMPDDERLGEFREDYAGLLGTLELQVDERPDGQPDFAGAAEVEGSEDLIERTLATPRDRIDARAFLRDRLMSVLLGDWDRHEGQFRWARFDEDSLHRWVPVPEDRDYAFSNYDGTAISLLRSALPEMVPFGERYPASLAGYTENSAEIDRRVLGTLPRSAWEAEVASLQRDLTDAEIDDAVRRMPPEHFALGGEELARVLRVRRDSLAGVAERFYLRIAEQPEMHGTDEAERLEVTRLEDGSVRVLLAPVSAPGSAARPLVDRVFSPAETRELSVDLRGGDDVALVTGEARESIPVRVVGGEGADTLVDRSHSDAWTAFHDPGEEGRVEGGLRTFVDRSVFQEPLWVPGEILPPLDWGASRSWFTPWVGYEGTQGVIVGGGPSWTWYGFRRFPAAGRASVTAMYALGSGEMGVDGAFESVHVGSAASTLLHARVSGLEALRFHGLGNASPASLEGAEEVVRYDQRLVELAMRFHPTEQTTLGIGPVIEWLSPEASAASHPHLSPEDRAAYGKVGLAGTLLLDTRPHREPLQGGFRLEGTAELYPEAWALESPFARVEAVATGYAALPGPAALAVRVGAAQVTGAAPLLESVSIGGSETLRGYAFQRFTGDAAIFTSVEARRRIARVRLLVNADLGALAFADAGRVESGGISGGNWHTGYGAGLWLGSLGRALSLTYARGERTTLYLKFGLPF